MLRRLVLAAIALTAAAVPLAGSARTIPAGINAHNGYIEINNWIKIKDAPPGKMPDPPVVRIKFHDSLIEQLHVPYGHTTYVNNCCFAAGTYYTVEVVTEARIVSTSVLPLLCNVRGIPFGFAVVNLEGSIFWHDKERRWVVDVRPHNAGPPCPTD